MPKANPHGITLFPDILNVKWAAYEKNLIFFTPEQHFLPVRIFVNASSRLAKRFGNYGVAENQMALDQQDPLSVGCLIAGAVVGNGRYE